jgi:nucleoside-diphosphate-sugar epimerase
MRRLWSAAARFHTSSRKSRGDDWSILRESGGKGTTITPKTIDMFTLRCTCNAGLLKQLGWKLAVPLEAGVQKAARWYCSLRGS